MLVYEICVQFEQVSKKGSDVPVQMHNLTRAFAARIHQMDLVTSKRDFVACEKNTDQAADPNVHKTVWSTAL